MATRQGLPRPLFPQLEQFPRGEGVACPESPPSFPLPSGSSARPGEACATPGIPLALAFRLARGLGAQGGPGCRLRAASLLVWRWKDTGLHGQLPLHSGCGGAASVVLRLQAGSGTQGPPPLKAQGQSDDGIPWRRVAGPRRLPCGTQFAVRPLWPRSPPAHPASQRFQGGGGGLSR